VIIELGSKSERDS